MITLSQIYQFSKKNNLNGDTDIFYILSQMQLEYKVMPTQAIQDTPSASKIEYSTQDLLDLFS